MYHAARQRREDAGAATWSDADRRMPALVLDNLPAAQLLQQSFDDVGLDCNRIDLNTEDHVADRAGM